MMIRAEVTMLVKLPIREQKSPTEFLTVDEYMKKLRATVENIVKNDVAVGGESVKADPVSISLIITEGI